MAKLRSSCLLLSSVRPSRHFVLRMMVCPFACRFMCLPSFSLSLVVFSLTGMNPPFKSVVLHRHALQVMPPSASHSFSPLLSLFGAKRSRVGFVMCSPSYSWRLSSAHFPHRQHSPLPLRFFLDSNHHSFCSDAPVLIGVRCCPPPGM